ncbi:MAG: V-type ATP synthase subunit I [Firmicutes bacterium]|mgnify:CR=1 FL=1|nr:V-type ATP synthase subunit I [Bacillota bacterium]
MAIVPMKRLELYGLVEHKSSFLSELQRLGLVELIGPVGEEKGLATEEEIAEKLRQVEEKLGEINRVLAIFERFAPQRPNFIEQFAGIKTVLTWEEQQNYIARREEAEKLAQQIFAAEKEHGLLEQERLKVEREMLALRPWAKLDLPAEEWRGSRRVAILLGSYDREPRILAEALTEAEVPCIYRVIGEDENRTYLIFFCWRDGQAEEILKAKGFVPSRPELTAGTVGERLVVLEAAAQELEAELTRVKETIESMADERPFFQTLYDYWYNQKRQVEAHRQLLMGKAVFGLEGWVPAGQAARVEKVLAALKLPHYLRISEPQPGEEIPILLQNTKVITPFEKLVEGFSYPRFDEVDPSPAIAPFFVLCYGMALGDAGYGVLLAAICAVLMSKLAMGPGGRKMAALFILSALGAVFFGLLTSSIFGYSLFNGVFNVIENPQLLLIVSLGLGLVQLYTGTIISAWMSIRKGDWAEAIWGKGVWLIFLTGLLLMAGGAQIGLGAYAQQVKYGTLAAAILLVLGNTRGKKGFGAKLKAIPGGLLTIYGSVSFFSDVLSYSRLMALGLSGAVMGSIINLFVKMTWGAPIGWIFAIIIFVIGHALNFGLNLLGAYVHSSRLQYLEFFNTFFTGGGRPFVPFKIENKNIFLKKEREV